MASACIPPMSADLLVLVRSQASFTNWQRFVNPGEGIDMAGPLEGIRVVELGVWVAGPAAGGILADWGADVIKIEPPTGDPARMFGRMLGLEDGASPPFEMDNRGKRSLVLDLTTDEDRGLALELVSGADVFITNVRPGALGRIGLDFETVAERNPRLVYGLITGYGT